jgi:uncharacterized OB-fold protein
MSLRGDKPCSNCGRLFTRAGRYCHACHADYMRAWRKAGNVTRETIFTERMNEQPQVSERAA